MSGDRVSKVARQYEVDKNIAQAELKRLSCKVKSKKNDEGSSLKKAMDLFAADSEEEDDQMED